MKYFGFSQSAISSQQITKESNAKMLFHIIEQEERISRAQLSKITGLSKSTVSVLTEEMIANNLIAEAGEGESLATGRKPILLEINSSGIQIPCFSFKPTGLLYVLYNLRFEVMEQIFVPYGPELARKPEDEGKKYVHPSNEAVIDIFEEILRNKSEYIRFDKVRTITISFTGSFDRGDNTFTSTMLGWAFDVEFINDLRKRLDNIPVLIGNISAFLAYAEKRSDKNSPDNLLYLYVGHGVGAGIILDNRPFTGESGISGEIGRQIVNKERFKPDSKYIHLEEVVSIDAIYGMIKDGIRNGKDTVVNELCEYNLDNLNMHIIKKAFCSDDALVIDTLQQIAEEIAAAISNTLCVLGSMDVFIGGGIEELGPKFLTMLNSVLKKIGYQRVLVRTRVQYSRLPQNGDCLGAARAFVDNQLTVV